MPNFNIMTIEYASKYYTNSLIGHLSSLLNIVSPRRAGAFSRDYFIKHLRRRAGLLPGL